MSAPNQIKCSSNIFIKYVDDDQISQAKIGDIMLYLHDDANALTKGDYYSLKFSGYLKTKIFDGKYWHPLDISKFCCNRENHYSKKEKAINTAELCREILSAKAPGIIVTKGYRAHYIPHELEE
jgi:hypothetical protein